MASFLTRYTQAAGMSTAAWMTLPVVLLPVCALTPTQNVAEPLWAQRPPDAEWMCADPYVHVVQLGNVQYLEDGHHRLARARRDHEEVIEGRLFVVVFT